MNYIFSSFSNLGLDILDFIKYDVLKSPLPECPQFPKEIKLKVFKEKKGYWVKSLNIPGFIASGKTLEELREAIVDTLLTYHDVPRAVAKRIPDTFILKYKGREVCPKIPLLQLKVEYA